MGKGKYEPSFGGSKTNHFLDEAGLPVDSELLQLNARVDQPLFERERVDIRKKNHLENVIVYIHYLRFRSGRYIGRRAFSKFISFFKRTLHSGHTTRIFSKSGKLRGKVNLIGNFCTTILIVVVNNIWHNDESGNNEVLPRRSQKMEKNGKLKFGYGKPVVTGKASKRKNLLKIGKRAVTSPEEADNRTKASKNDNEVVQKINDPDYDSESYLS